MTLVKIAPDRYLNLAAANDIKIVTPDLIRVYWNFAVTGGYTDALQTAYDEYTGSEAAALIAWLDRNAADATAPQVETPAEPEAQPKIDPLADLRAAARMAGAMFRAYSPNPSRAHPRLDFADIQAIGPARGLYRYALSYCDLDHDADTAWAYVTAYNDGLEGM